MLSDNTDPQSAFCALLKAKSSLRFFMFLNEIDTYPKAKPQTKAPDIAYCKENVLHVFNDYRRMITYGRERNKAFTIISLVCDGYEFLEHKKKQLFPRAVLDNWEVMRRDTFEKLVRLLHEQGFLTLYDNRHLYQSGEAAYHALDFLLQTEKESAKEVLMSLAGAYRFFTFSSLDCNNQTVAENTPLDDFMIMIGKLNIEYDERGNYFKTVSECMHCHKTLSFHYHYKGVINYLSHYHNISVRDFDYKSGVTRHISLMPNKRPNYTIMEGMILMVGDAMIHSRGIIFDNLHTEDSIKTVPFQSPDIPEDYRGILEKCKSYLFKQNFQ